MKVCLGLVCSALCWAALPAVASGQTVTFFPTGAQQTFVVPAGVTTVDVVNVGASGGGAVGMAPGGLGGRASAHLPVTSGQVLYVEVGGNGGSGSASRSAAGGFNGGGAGGSQAGGGGGASDVRTLPISDSGSLASRLVVAGGGGGGAQGSGGANADASGAGDGAGGAGTQTGNGMGGDAIDNAAPGSPGAFGIGGAGGTGSTGGAGGGGGVFGGGGGGASCSENPMYCDAFTLGGNGGGGASGFASGLSNTSVGADTSGVGSVTITYTGPPPSSPPPARPSIKVIASSLLAQLAPRGKAGRLSAIRKHHGYAFAFSALLAGTVTISWDEIQHTRVHGHTKTRTVLIAKGSRRFGAAGEGPLTIRLTAKGSALFKHARRLKLTAKGAFKPSGAAAIARQKAFTLHG